MTLWVVATLALAWLRDALDLGWWVWLAWGIASLVDWGLFVHRHKLADAQLAAIRRLADRAPSVTVEPPPAGWSPKDFAR